VAVVLVRVVVVKGDNKMPKFYGQNKKRIDPRYFLNETIEEGERPPWEDPNQEPRDPMNRAQDLAKQGMDDATQRTLGLFDGALEDGTPVVDVLSAVRKHLNTPAGSDILADFDALLAQLGVDLGEPQSNMPGDDSSINRDIYGSDHHPNDPSSPGYSRNS
jgi:hypothetical protein